jgi:hypothetical protein
VLVIFFVYPSYDSNHLHLTHAKSSNGDNIEIMDAIDLKNYTESVEWDITHQSAYLNLGPTDGILEDFHPCKCFLLNQKNNLDHYMY